jgi:FimV-like protein
LNNVLAKKPLELVQAAVLVFLLVLPSLSWGLSLGRLSLSSALNQPLSAKIEISNGDALAGQEIRVGLASKEVFEELGIKWSYNLEGLSFSVERSPSGLAVIVSSDDYIVEPFLNFAIEVIWPRGRIIREYTVFLDPPILTARGMIIPLVDQDREVTAGALLPSKLKKGADSDRMTRAGDTLWAIALAARPRLSISVQVMMLEIQRLNPEAFIDANINRLKAGYVLRMPSDNEFSRLDKSEAIAAVDQQNRALESDETAPRLVDSERGLDVQPTGVGESQLVILAEEDESLIESPAPSSSAAALESALSTAEAEVTQAFEENRALQNRLSGFEAQLADLAGAVTIKDAQIARLQKQLAGLGQPPVSVKSPFLATTTVGLLAVVVLLFVGLLLLSARLRRLGRNLQLTQNGGPNLALEGARESGTEMQGMPNEPVNSAAAVQDNVSAVLPTRGPADSGNEQSGSSLNVQDDRRKGEGESATPRSGYTDPAAFTEAEIKGSGLPLAGSDVDLVEINFGDLEEFEGLEMLDLDEIDTKGQESHKEAFAESNAQTITGEDEELDPGEDPTSMLDLARAYVEMEHHQEARKLLARVIEIGLPHEVADAQQMLASLTE